jgi:zinc transporter ZupT
MNEENQNSENRNEPEEFGVGIAFTVGLHIIFAGILFALSLLQDKSDYTMFFPLMVIGITQTIYMIPAFVIAKGKGKEQLAKGLLVGAAITFLLNAACAGYGLWDAGLS